MTWLFVVGVALEISGVILIAAPVVASIVRRRWSDLAILGYVFPRGGPLARDMHGTSYTLVGVLFLVMGFVVQLAGYVVQADDIYFALAAAAVVVGTTLAGIGSAQGPLARWLLRKAQANDPVKDDR